MIGPDAFELLIRLNPKSLRGKRRFPASLQMSKQEIRLLLDYYKQRSSEIGFFGDNYLMAHPERKSGRLADDALYTQTRMLLHDITKDETLRLYHARHTFNSCLQMQFQLRGKALFNHYDFLNLDVSIENDKKLRNALEGNEHWGRKDQHVQAILVGHASPEMTNQYYNHLNDVLLGCLVQQERDRVPITLKGLMTLSGLSQSRAGELFSDNEEHPLAGLVKNQARKHAARLLHPLVDSRFKVFLRDWKL